MEIKTVQYEGTDMITVNGLLAAQPPEVLRLLNELPKFPLIIEIGTCRGGFALALRKHNPTARIVTIDSVNWEPINAKISQFEYHHIEFMIGDCFQWEPLKELIGCNKKKIVFCDGGNKADEFNTFSSYINPGDIIGAHDYWDNQTESKWTNYEIEFSKIETEVKNNNLKRVFKEAGNRAAWGIFQKQ